MDAQYIPASVTKVLCTWRQACPNPGWQRSKEPSLEGTELREGGRPVTEEIQGCSNQLVGKKLKRGKYTEQSRLIQEASRHSALHLAPGKTAP